MHMLLLFSKEIGLIANTQWLAHSANYFKEESYYCLRKEPATARTFCKLFPFLQCR